MKTNTTLNPPQDKQAEAPRAAMRVRTDVRAGDWNCSNCQGTVNGSQLFRPTCEYCRPS